MCCGRPSRPSDTPITRQVARASQEPKKSAVKPLVRARTGKRCERCSYITMAIYLAGRERYQCTNSQCRAIAK